MHRQHMSHFRITYHFKIIPHDFETTNVKGMIMISFMWWHRCIIYYRVWCIKSIRLWAYGNQCHFHILHFAHTVVLIKFLLYSGARAGADSPAPLAPRRWRRLPTGAGNFTPLAAELSRCPPELFFTAGTTLIAARALVYGNPTRAPVKSSSVMPQVCVNELDQHWFREWLVAYLAPSHYLNQCWGYCHCQLNP